MPASIVPTVHTIPIQLWPRSGNNTPTFEPDCPRMLSQNDPLWDDPQLASEVADWEASLSDAWRQWCPLEIVDATSTSGATLTRLDDGTWLSGGPRPEKDVYRFTAVAPADKALTGIRVEVLPHESLPVGGPGRHENGNFQLTELQLYVCDAADRSAKTRVVLSNPRSDFDQDKYPVVKVIDDNQSTGWSVDPLFNQDHQATFELSSRLQVEPGKLLSIELHQQYGSGHLIGRLRLSATAAPPSAAAAFEPSSEKLQQIVATAVAARTPEQRRVLTGLYLDKKITRQLSELPPQRVVYCGSNRFQPTGYFHPATTPATGARAAPRRNWPPAGRGATRCVGNGLGACQPIRIV